MSREIDIANPLRRPSNLVTCPEPVFIDSPQDVIAEVKKIILLIFNNYEFNQFEQAFDDIVRLFNGNYHGYRHCNTFYHDLNHTMDCLFVTAKLIYGAVLNGINFEKRDVTFGVPLAGFLLVAVLLTHTPWTFLIT
jgi:hypothetical protein